MRRRLPILPIPNKRGGGRLSAAEPEQSRGAALCIARRLSPLVFFAAAMFMFAVDSLRKSSEAATQFYTAASIRRYKKKRRRLAVKNSGLNSDHEDIFDAKELKKYFGCSKAKRKRPVVTKEEWRYLRDLYNDFVAIEASRGRNDTYKLGSSDIAFPVTGVMTSDKGRGLVASRDIKKGELIFTSTNNTIAFRTGNAWRGFLLHLYYSPPLNDHYKDGFACDVKAWSWNQEIETSDGTVVAILTDLDATSLLNKPSKGEVHNIKCGERGEEEVEGECGVDYYAVRDIKKGEEILGKYSDFSILQWHTFGL